MFLARAAEWFARIGSAKRFRSVWMWWKPLRSMYRLWKRMRPVWGFFAKAVA